MEQKLEALAFAKLCKKWQKNMVSAMLLLVIVRRKDAKLKSGILLELQMKACEYEKVSEALFLWFTQQRGVPITGPLLQEKALVFHKEFNEGESNFTASIGWIDH
jgi:hypothetical protein